MQGTIFNFVIDCSDAELAVYKAINPEDARIFNRGDLNWCLRTYLILSKRGRLKVSCSNILQKEAINLVHSDQLLRLHGKPADFIVCVQADFPRRHWAQYHIVQNKNQLTAGASYLPHWLQPGLLMRDADRQGVRRIAYAGQAWNGNLAGPEESWRRLFEPYGLEFISLPAAAWHDLRTVDVLIGIRSFDTKPHNAKPPSKLFNAWQAGIPFIGGHDSAYRQAGTPEEDYIIASTPEETVSAVLRLQADADLYARLVQNGWKKIKHYTEDCTAALWEQVLTGPVTVRYLKWLRRPRYEQGRFRMLLLLAMLMQQPKHLIKKWLAKGERRKIFKTATSFK